MRKIIKFIPNTITIVRIIMSVVFALNVLRKFAYGQGEVINLIAVFIIICLSDLLDGRIARKTGCTSTIGAKLDVFADLFFIVFSYTVLIFLGMIPLWFLGFICIKFIEFLITSSFINSYNNSSRHPFIFDKLGRIVSAMFFIIPGIVCILKALIPNQSGYLINILVYTILVSGVYSSYLRIKDCLRAVQLKDKLQEE